MLKIFEEEIKGGIAFFKDGMGRRSLVRDRFPRDPKLASIASSGFALSSFAIGAHYGFLSKEEAERLCLLILTDSLLIESDHGFFYHFYDMDTTKPTWWTELSNIDTALYFMGVIVAGNFFGGRVAEAARQILERADWSYWKAPDKPYLYMGKKKDGFFAYWQDYAEQLMIYVLAGGAAKTEYSLSDDYYRQIDKPMGQYGPHRFIYSHTNGVFTHLYSQLFIPFKGKKDPALIDWHQNSVEALKAHYEFCEKEKGQRPSCQLGWGLSACDAADGYHGDYGVPPGCGVYDGTIAIYAALGALPFCPEEGLEAFKKYAQDPRLQSRYGLIDSFNLENGFFADGVIGIDKGIALIGLANYLDGFIWEINSQERIFAKGFETLGIK